MGNKGEKLQELREVYIGPDNTGQINIAKIKEVLKRNGLVFYLKEIELMRWGEENELGQIVQVEDDIHTLNQAIDDLRDSGIDNVSDYTAGDFED